MKRSTPLSSETSGSKGRPRLQKETMDFVTKSLICTAALFILARNFAVRNLWIVVVGICACAVPIFLSQFYLSTMAQIRTLHAFERHGRLYHLFSRRWFKLTFWILWSLTTSFFMLIQFHTYSLVEWFLFFLVIPVFWMVYRTAKSVFSKELKSYLITYSSLLWAKRITPPIMSLLSVLLVLVLQDFQVYESWSDAIEAQMGKVEDMVGSALVFEASHWLAYYEGAKAYVLCKLRGQEPSWWFCGILVVSVYWMIYFNACAILSCLLIPRVEYRRIFVPLTDAAIPPEPTKAHIAAISAVATIVVFFIYMPLIVGLENWVRQNPQIKESREKAQSKITLYVEKIEGEYYHHGTMERLVQLQKEALLEDRIMREKLSATIDREYDVMEARVDSYLDWYYSLPAEYQRIAKMLIGEVEQYLFDEFEEKVLNDQQLKNIIDTILDYGRLLEQFRSKVQDILDENRLDPSLGPFKVVRSLEQIPDLTVPPVVIDFKTRLQASSAAGVGAGLLSAIIVKKILNKLAVKMTFKMAAKVLAKVTASKVAAGAGGAAAGATIGGALGSAVPGVGTAVGAAIGGAIGGLAVGVSVDKLLLMLEESLNRDQFKAEIVEELREVRQQLKTDLGLNELR